LEPQKKLPIYEGDRLLNHTGLAIGLLMNFGERKLNFRRVLASPSATEFRHNHQWIFVPDWLKAQKQEEIEDIPF
jgi:hypothetical protein